MAILNVLVKCIMVDGGSLCDVLFLEPFQKLGFNP